METNKLNLTSDMIMSSVSGAGAEEANNKLSALNEAVGTKRDMEAIQRAMAEQYVKMHTTYKKEYDISRNAPCPCGSGKKYKNCCLKTGKYEQYVKA